MEVKRDLYCNAKKLCICTETLLDRLVEDGGLTASQSYLLLYILQEHSSGAYVTELHRELGLSKGAISGSVKRLRQKGFLTAEILENDERHKRVIPTDKSNEIISRLSAAVQQTEDTIYGGLAAEERAQLFQLQEKALKRAEKVCKNEGGISV